jgi:hypothetical protein
MHKLVDEKPLQRHVARAEIVAEQIAFRVEPQMAVGSHGDLLRLKPPPFAIVNTDPIIIQRIAENAARKRPFRLGQWASRRVRTKHQRCCIRKYSAIGRDFFDRGFNQYPVAIGKDKFDVDPLQPARGHVDPRQHQMLPAMLEFDRATSRHL